MLFVKMEITLDCRNQIVTRSKLSEYSTFRIWEYPKISPWERYQCIRRHVTYSAACWRQSVCRERFCLCTAMSALLSASFHKHLSSSALLFYLYYTTLAPSCKDDKRLRILVLIPLSAICRQEAQCLLPCCIRFCAQNSTGFSSSEP